MRIIHTEDLIPVIKNLAQKACFELDENLISSLNQSFDREESPLGKEIIATLLENAKYASEEQIPCCQDTGVAVVYLEIGQEVSWQGEPLACCVNEGIRQGYKEGYLRNSVVDDPILRINTNDNTPAVIHTEIIPGDKVRITVMPKGFGSENMNRAVMLTPADGVEGIKKFVIDTVRLAGGKACPPLVIGVGLGGTTEVSTWLAKKSLLRPIGAKNAAPHLAKLEEELKSDINDLGIGPLGLGGRITALDVHVEAFATHIAGLPVAVNLQCHASRHASVIL